MVAWALLTAAAAVAQILGAPVAGARLLLYLFAVPILIAALLWVAARFVRGSLRAPIGGVIAVLLVLGTVGALMARVWHGDQRRTWVESKAVAQLAAAGDYLARFAPGRGVVFSFRKGGGTTIVRWKNTVRAGLPPGVVPRVRGWALGSPIDQLNALSPGGGTGSGSTGGASGPIIVVIEAYNRPGFEDAHLAYPDSFVSPGVLALNGPIAPTVIPEKRAASANTHGANLLWLAALAAAILLAVGGGWSIVLLPTDPVVRAALAPALGLGASVLAALVWDRLALGLHGWRGVGPLVIAACAGWGVAWLRMIRLRRVPDGQVPRGPVGDGAPIEPPPAASAVP